MIRRARRNGRSLWPWSAEEVWKDDDDDDDNNNNIGIYDYEVINKGKILYWKYFLIQFHCCKHSIGVLLLRKVNFQRTYAITYNGYSYFSLHMKQWNYFVHRKEESRKEVNLHTCNLIKNLIFWHLSFTEPYIINMTSKIRYKLQIY